MQAQRARFGALIKALRKERGWSQEDAAHEVGVGVKTWQLWERGKTTPYDVNVRKIGEVFDVEPDELIARAAPLGLGAAADGEIAEQLGGIREMLANHAAKIEELLARQSAILERIEKATTRADGAAQTLEQVVEQARRDLPPAAARDQQPAEKARARKRSPRASS